ncbi:MAG: hypothetical protein LBJ76_05200 [Candidatus Accumulibacter sp.]|jgi:hypothetical protein|nr:hypothetical protein [Accumulibacter sp.]
MARIKKVTASSPAVSKTASDETQTDFQSGDAPLPSRKRRRLSKAFPRPLDKKIRGSGMVRDTFIFPETEYQCLVEIKERLLIGGIKVKKSELLRAGFALLFALDDEKLKSLVSKVCRPQSPPE